MLKIVYLNDQENADRFFRFYKDDFYENDDFDLSARDLKDSYYCEKVYKYDRFELPYKIEGGVVYSMLDDWVKVGTIKRKIPEGSAFYLFPNIYKYVGNDSVEKVSGDHYFGFEIEYKKKVGI